jgi:putative intracellular protease/amidase
VDLASVAAYKEVTLARGTKLTADYSISKLPRVDYDVIVCPGGMPGAVRPVIILQRWGILTLFASESRLVLWTRKEHLAASETLIHMLQNHKRAGKYIAAICASPAKVFKVPKSDCECAVP